MSIFTCKSVVTEDSEGIAEAIKVWLELITDVK